MFQINNCLVAYIIYDTNIDGRIFVVKKID